MHEKVYEKVHEKVYRKIRIEKHRRKNRKILSSRQFFMIWRNE